ncbi:hypothetical protein [Aurantivibrio plasticivorans]
MNEIRSQIDLYQGEKTIGQISLTARELDHGVEILYTDSEDHKGHTKSRDFFYALAENRETYEKVNAFLMCKGSLKNVYPGGFTSEQSNSLLAYSYSADNNFSVVNILDPIAESEKNNLGTLKDQRASRDKAFSNQPARNLRR